MVGGVASETFPFVWENIAKIEVLPNVTSRYLAYDGLYIWTGVWLFFSIAPGY